MPLVAVISTSAMAICLWKSLFWTRTTPLTRTGRVRLDMITATMMPPRAARARTAIVTFLGRMIRLRLMLRAAAACAWGHDFYGAGGLLDRFHPERSIH